MISLWDSNIKIKFSFSSFSLLGLLIDEGVGLLNLEGKSLPGGEELLDLLHWQLDEHTSDLWSLLGSNDQLHIVEDEVTNLLLQVRVSLNSGWEEFVSGELILLLWGHVSSVDHWGGWWHWGTWLSRWHLGHWHTWLWHHLLWHWCLWLVLSLLWHWLSTHLLTTSHVVHLLHVLVLVVVSSLVVSLSHTSSTSHVVHLVSSSIVHLLVHGLVLLDEGQKLLDDLGQMWLTGQVVPLESTSLLGLVVLEISLILGFLELDLSEFLDLIMVNDENLISIGLVGESALGSGGGVWLLVADESISITSLTSVKSDLLDLTTLFEEVSEIILSPVGWEVLHVQVASLLGVLVLDGLLDLLDGSISLLDGVSYVQFHILVHLFVLQTLDGFVGTLWTVLLVDLGWVVIADETKFTDVILVEDERFDGSIWLEHLLDLIVRPIEWNVLDIDIVDELSHISSVLWLELASLDLIGVSGGLEGFGGRVLILEAYETVSSGGVVGVEGDLKTLDVSMS